MVQCVLKGPLGIMSQYMPVTEKKKKGSMKVNTQKPSDVRPNSDEIIPSSASPDVVTTGRPSTSSEAAKNNLPTNQTIRYDPGQDPTVSIRCLPSELMEHDMIKNLELQPEQFEEDMIDEFQCWTMHLDDIIALVQESDQWNKQIMAMAQK